MEGYEDFSEVQRKILSRYVTNIEGDIFVLHNLPEVIKGALFSRYSRSSLGLRSLLLKEFIQGDEIDFASMIGIGEESEDKEVLLSGRQIEAIKKAQNFYDRILDGYGDDSIGELGGAHLAIENVSMIGAKMIENSRIGGSPLEKSTRYIYFDQKVRDQYMYYREPILMTSAYRGLYTQTCDMLFDTYSELIGPTTEMMEKRYPKDSNTAKGAYTAALRAKVLDCLRGLLPASTMTNMGVFGNGRFWEYLLHKLQSQNLTELKEIGRVAYGELAKVIPSFVRRAEATHHTQLSYQNFSESLDEQLKNVAGKHPLKVSYQKGASVKLIASDSDALVKVAAALLYGQNHYGLEELQAYVRTLDNGEISNIFDAASSMRENRRHKSPRALEHAEFTFEIIADFGAYRDLQRHRTLTQDRQFLTTHHGYYISEELQGTMMEKKYREAMERAQEAFLSIAAQLPEEAQYVVPMAYNVRWYFHINLRSLVWLAELRSGAAGHPSYRFIAQELARLVIERFPLFECFFKFVDYDGHELGRLGQEERKEAKQRARETSK